MKRKLLSVCLAVSMALSLCACGNKEVTDNKKTESLEGSKEVSNGEEYTLNQYLKSGQKIWYRTDGTGKDSNVTGIYITEADGTLIVTEDYEGTLGDVEQMEDSEIVLLVKELAGSRVAVETDKLKQKFLYSGNEVSWNDKTASAEERVLDFAAWAGFFLRENSPYKSEYMSTMEAMIAAVDEEQLCDVIESRAHMKEESAEEYYEVCSGAVKEYFSLNPSKAKLYVAEIDAFCEKAEDTFKAEYANLYQAEADKFSSNPITYELVITSDSTGNKTSKEAIVFKDNIPVHVSGSSKYSFGIKPYIFNLDELIGKTVVEIYDSNYGGYCETDDGSVHSYFLTRMDESCTFMLDEVGTEGISIDNIGDHTTTEIVLTIETF